jgi:hypothetical protein
VGVERPGQHDKFPSRTFALSKKRWLARKFAGNN